MALRRLAKARGRELARLKALAEDVLRARTDVETFLVTSLRMVRPPVRTAGVGSIKLCG